jgi:hypothetical protein
MCFHSLGAVDTLPGFHKCTEYIKVAHSNDNHFQRIDNNKNNKGIYPAIREWILDVEGETNSTTAIEISCPI